MKTRTTILLVLLGLVSLFGINYMFFTGTLTGLPSAVEDVLKSDERVLVTSAGNKLIMEPVAGADVGLVMYGEGKEDVRMYAPIGRMLAVSGIKVVFMSRRLEMRVSDERLFTRIDAVLKDDPTIAWYIGGHTSGARIPATYAKSHADSFHGIVLWAARLSEASDLSDISLPVLFVYGTLDDANVDLVKSNTPLVPSDTTWISIEGGNRADFAYWGPMAADVGSTISLPDLQNQASKATIGFVFP